jgi:hypothetical protein
LYINIVYNINNLKGFSLLFIESYIKSKCNSFEDEICNNKQSNNNISNIFNPFSSVLTLTNSEWKIIGEECLDSKPFQIIKNNYKDNKEDDNNSGLNNEENDNKDNNNNENSSQKHKLNSDKNIKKKIIPPPSTFQKLKELLNLYSFSSLPLSSLSELIKSNINNINNNNNSFYLPLFLLRCSFAIYKLSLLYPYEDESSFLFSHLINGIKKKRDILDLNKDKIKKLDDNGNNSSLLLNESSLSFNPFGDKNLWIVKPIGMLLSCY